MLTRCPACQTLYRIDDEVLQRAGGQARCFRCETVFEAATNQAQPDAQDPTFDGQVATPTEQAADDDSLALSELSALAELPEVPEADALEPRDGPELSDLVETLRPPTPAAGSDAPLDLTLDLDPGDRDDPPLRLDPPFDAPEPPPGSAAATESPTAPATTTPPRHAWPAWLAAGLLLLLALAQLAWLNRELVQTAPGGPQLVASLCRLAGCTPPVRRAPSRYAVLERHIGPDPQQPGTLVMRLSFRNQADFAQPLPDIQLSLYDTEERLMARRRLHPDEYLFPAPAPDTRVAPGGTVLVDLRLEDPGRYASSYKLEFL